MVEIHDRSQLAEAVAWAKSQQLPIIVIGGGSNIIWRDEGFAGLLIVNKITRYESLPEDDTTFYITAGAGEDWDSVVARTVEAGLSGIECLSLIPGSAGATPVQNVGAYGQEIASTLVTVEAYDMQTDTFVPIMASDCDFGYRTSRFKTTDKGRFIITAITLRLSKTSLQPPFYGSLQAYLEDHSISDYSPSSVRGAVIAIRSAKLPDPAIIANNGSFFANPIIDESSYAQLSADLEVSIPHWETSDGHIKLSAAWLIEQAGFKDAHGAETGMATWPTQPLVLVNEHAKNTADLLAFRQSILDAVKAKFDINLVQEPELLP